MVTFEDLHVLDAFMSGRISDTAFETWWKEHWGYAYSLYKPIFDAAKAAGAPVIELHTGHYAAATGEEQQAEFKRIREAVEYGNRIGLKVNARHGLNYDNVAPVAAVPGIAELNIGHAIVAHAGFVGWEAADW